MLWMALEHIKPGLVVELGCGDGSTLPLWRYCEDQRRKFISLESDDDWLVKIATKTGVQVDYIADMQKFIIDYEKYTLKEEISILFVDCKPGEVRKDIIAAFAHKAKVIVVHDTEQIANYVYNMSDVLSTFAYRCEITNFDVRTTAVSNFYDLSRWKGVRLGPNMKIT